MSIWSLILLLPTAIGLVMVLVGAHGEWLNASMAALVVLWGPPAVYFRVTDLTSQQRVQPREYPRVSISGHSAKDGRLKVSSWRWTVVMPLGLLFLGTVGLATMFTLTAAYVGSSAWWMSMALWGLIGLLILGTCINSLVSTASLMRLQAAVELMHPKATFAISKSDQVCSGIACADRDSDPSLWNIYTQHAVVAMAPHGITVWDQSRGRPVKVAAIAWERVHAIRLSIAPVPWRFARAIELQLSRNPEDSHAGVLLAPIYYRRGFMRPLPDAAFSELQARIEEHLRARIAR